MHNTPKRRISAFGHMNIFDRNPANTLTIMFMSIGSVFFTDQSEFSTGDFVEVMNKDSSMSLVCNAILYWNTIKIRVTVESLRDQGENISDDALSHISLLPYRQVLPNGNCFVGSP